MTHRTRRSTNHSFGSTQLIQFGAMAFEVTRFVIKELVFKRWYVYPFVGYALFSERHENLRQDYFRNRSQLVGGMKEPNW